MSHQSGVHPEIGSLIRQKDRMWDQLREKNYTGALETMTIILYDIKREDAPQELIDTINKEYYTVASYVNEAQRVDRLKAGRSKYFDWGRQITHVLWSKDYLINKKYGVETKRDTTFKTKPWTETDVDEVEI